MLFARQDRSAAQLVRELVTGVHRYNKNDPPGDQPQDVENESGNSQAPACLPAQTHTSYSCGSPWGIDGRLGFIALSMGVRKIGWPRPR